jgi:hypothetical protein
MPINVQPGFLIESACHFIGGFEQVGERPFIFQIKCNIIQWCKSRDSQVFSLCRSFIAHNVDCINSDRIVIWGLQKHCVRCVFHLLGGEIDQARGKALPRAEAADRAVPGTI